MITNSFDDKSEAIISLQRKENATKVDVCIITFSSEIEQYVVENYSDNVIGYLYCATGKTPIYAIEKDGKTIAFYKTYIGSSVTVGFVPTFVTDG